MLRKKRKPTAQTKKDRAVKKEVTEEISQKLVNIRKEKKKKKIQPTPSLKPKVTLKVGDKVRMLGGKSVGSIDAIEKKKAIVNYGLFTTQVSLNQLEIVN